MLAARMVLALTCLCLIPFIPYEIAKENGLTGYCWVVPVVALLAIFTSSNYLESRSLPVM